MNTVPIAFAFDNNMVLPAQVCISSLMMNAGPDTFYDIFILHSEKGNLTTDGLDRIPDCWPNCRIQYRAVGPEFDNAFEIRGVTTPTYYRLLIPELIPEYDKIVYSDVDVIFREDLSGIWLGTDLGDNYFAGVNSLSDRIPGYSRYYSDKLALDPGKIIYAGNLIVNSRKLLQDGMTGTFRTLAQRDYTYQDMDIINVASQGKITYLPPSFCLTNYINGMAVNSPEKLSSLWSEDEIRHALKCGTVHYNGQKPWKGLCPNFDIWWEYYRKSPFFDEKRYFKFFNDRLNELDRLSLWKRIKILVRWFIYR